MKYFNRVLIVLITMVTVSCQNPVPGMAGTTPPNHEPWNQLLKAHVSPTGIVDYKGFIKDKSELDAYLRTISANAPDRKVWSKNEQLAYWINAYNAFTVSLIVENYPVKSIKNLGPALKIPFIKDVWHYNFFKIGGKESSLNEIEHSILRKEFDEPRIHFAINCASFSCPPLLNEAFTASKIEAQLDKVATTFVNDESRNKITANALEISSIFSWFRGDFTENGSIVDFLNKYSSIKINSNAKMSYMDYNWNLNE
jgi:hypothetical protein